MKKIFLLSIAGVTLIALTATTIYAQVANTSIVDRMKAAVHAFTLSAELNSGQTGYESAPVSGKKTGNMLTAAEWNRMLEIVSQGSAGGSSTGCTPSSGNVYDSGWIDFQTNPVQTLTHNLGTMDTVVFMEMKSDKDYSIAHTVPITLQPNKSHLAYGNFYTKWYNKTENTISVTTANNIQTMSDRYVRIIMIKTSALGGGCGGTSSPTTTPSNLVYINPDNTDFAPLECTPGINYMINPIAFSAASASTYTDKKLAVLKPGNWRAKGTNFSRNRNITSGSSHTLRFNSILDGVTSKLYENTVDLGLYASSFSKDITVPAGKTAEINVSVRNNTIYGGTVTVWCTN